MTNPERSVFLQGGGSFNALNYVHERCSKPEATCSSLFGSPKYEEGRTRESDFGFGINV